MFLGPLIGFAACQSEFPDGLAFAVAFGHEANIAHPAIAGDTDPAAFQEVCVVDKV
jgi:hypothetical protein